jgi:succinoglycan biosynthesis transport protein ExoP
MLQSSLRRLEPLQSDRPEGPSPTEFYAACIGFLRRRLPVIALASLLSAILGAAYLYTAHPIYTGRALLIVDAPKMQVYQSQSAQDGPISSATVDTQIQIIKSDDIALSVIKELHLDQDPDFLANSHSVFARISAALKHLWSRALGPNAAGAPDSLSTESTALAAFQRRLSVKRVDMTYAIEIDFQAQRPFRAAKIANAIADAYELNAFDAKYQITGQAAKWLQNRLGNLRQQATSAERAVVDYETKKHIVVTGGELLDKQQLAELDSELVQARATTAQAKARLDRVENVLNSNQADPDAAGAVTDSIHDDVINKMREKYLQDERRAAEWGALYGEQHAAVRNLRNQMTQLNQTILQEVGRIADSYRSDYAIAKSREDSIQQSLDHLITQAQTTDQAEVTLHSLESNAQTARELYDNFLQRYMQSVQQQSSPVSETRLITHARPPLQKSWPRPGLVMALSLLGGVIFGTAIGMLKDVSDRVFRTTQQISEHLQVDCLAVLPFVKSIAGPAVTLEKVSSASAPPTPDRAEGGVASILSRLFAPIRRMLLSAQHGLFRPLHRRRRRRTLRIDKGLCWTVTNAPFSRFSESIRAVKVAADGDHGPSAGKIIGITSSLPNEGKSTVAISLAALIAQGGSRVVLADCDLRNPSLTRLLTPNSKAGLLEVVAGKAAVEDVLWREPQTGLAFLPSVVTSRLAHSSDILGSEETRQLFEQFSKSYDYIIMDLCPLAPVVDARVASRLVDSFLLVVEWGRTKIEVVQHALRCAPGVYNKSLGIVLNKADMKSFVRYAGEHETYYSNPYYSQYGYTD